VQQLTSPDTAGSDLAEWVVLEWAKKDAVAAASWASVQGDSSLQDRLLVRVTIGYASNAPEQALALALNFLQPGETLNRTAAEIIRQWTEKNPTAAAEGLAQLPTGEARNRATDALLAAWSDYDPAQAKRWVLSQPGSAELQLGL